ncbi:FAD-binding protein [Pseudoalteromonas obscura]|uniref:FAD-binding protein n=1 Tax=Pseudoalteromonas obscura TaxID=3048491 RepID=A0ABT7EE49_9GAMM|nr:FAD-binding protein [Pseudoalteromonas sp. P94(2023)]MDK2593547.1 FAD-binding protein [Pseudoalteromonas sp. P94(2023)]
MQKVAYRSQVLYKFDANNADLKVYRPTNRADVVLAFQDIIDTKEIKPHEVQITCGRHCYESFVYNGETKAIIDVGSLNGFDYSKKPDTIEMEIGLSNWEMYRILNNIYKRTLPAGSCYSVGLGGHVTGGGYGLLSRMYGLAMDYLIGVYIVVQNSRGVAEEIYCDQDQHCDLFWGVKGGGGGQFGIITKLIFKDAPPSPERMYTINFSWDWQDENGDYLSQEQFTQIIRLLEESFCDQDPQTWHVWANMLLNHKDAKNISITAFVYYIPQFHGDWAAFELKVRNEFSAILKKANQIKLLSKGDFNYTLRDYTYLNGTQQVSPSGPNSFGKYKSAYLTKCWTKDMINSAYAFLRKPISYQDGEHVTRADMARSLR